MRGLGRALCLLVVCAAWAEEPRPAWVAANFVGDPPPSLMRSREGWLRWTGLWGARRLQHGGLVTGVAVSPDGKWIASASEDGTVRQWEARAGNQIRSLAIGPGGRGLALSPDGRRIHTGDFGAVRAWDAATGLLLGSSELGLEINGLRLSADGRLLVYWGGFGFQICDAATCHFATTLWAGQSAEPVRDAVFTSDGKRLITCGDGNLVTSWEVSSGATTSFAGPDDEGAWFHSVAVDPRGEEVAASWKTGELLRWNLKTGESLPALGRSGESIAYSPDGATIAAGGSDGVGVWRRATGECVWSADDPVVSIAFAPDGSWLVSGGEDGAVRIRLTATGEECAGEERLPHEVSSLAVSADGAWGATALWSEVRIWDAATGALRGRFERDGLFTQAIATTPDGRVACDWGKYTADDSWVSRITLWDPVTGEDQVAPQVPFGGGVSVAVEPRERWIVATCAEGPAVIWDLQTGRQLRTIPGDPRSAATAVAARNGRIAEVRRPLLLARTSGSSTCGDPTTRRHLSGSNTMGRSTRSTSRRTARGSSAPVLTARCACGLREKARS